MSLNGWLHILIGVPVGAVIAVCTITYHLRDRHNGHAGPREAREPARHAAPAKRVISRAPVAGGPPEDFLDIPSYPPAPHEDTWPGGSWRDKDPGLRAVITGPHIPGASS